MPDLSEDVIGITDVTLSPSAPPRSAEGETRLGERAFGGLRGTISGARTDPSSSVDGLNGDSVVILLPSTCPSRPTLTILHGASLGP